MLTALGRLATACPKLGFKSITHPYGQPAMVKSPLQQQGLLHTGSVFYKKKSKGASKPEPASEAKTPFKCDDLSKLCPDPCIDDEEMDAIADHVGGRCEKDPCARVREPCESYVKKHIGGKKKPCKKADAKKPNGSKKAETKPTPTASKGKAETKPVPKPTGSKDKGPTSSKLPTDANKKPTVCTKKQDASSKKPAASQKTTPSTKPVASQKTTPSTKPVASIKKPSSPSKVPIDTNKHAACKKKPNGGSRMETAFSRNLIVASQIKATPTGKATNNAKKPDKKK